MADMTSRVDQWLRDAHAMEEQAESLLSGQADRIKTYPALKARLQQHLEETRTQAKRLERCLERRNASSSGLKDFAGKFTATMQNMSGMFAGDEVVKSVLANYSFEHMEIASYRILSAAARIEGDLETAAVCEEICREEEAMAKWLEEHMGEVAQEHLLREEADLEVAKR